MSASSVMSQGALISRVVVKLEPATLKAANEHREPVVAPKAVLSVHHSADSINLGSAFVRKPFNPQIHVLSGTRILKAGGKGAFHVLNLFRGQLRSFALHNNVGLNTARQRHGSKSRPNNSLHGNPFISNMAALSRGGCRPVNNSRLTAKGGAQ